jgi:uncharacterized protein
MAKPGDLWWTELHTLKSEKAIKFYTQLMGWTHQTMSTADMLKPAEPGEPGYTLFLNDGVPVCGCATMPDGDKNPPRWFTHLQVKDVDDSVALAQKLGGKLISGPWNVPTVGRVAIIADTEGATVGIGVPESAAQSKKTDAKKPAAKKKDPEHASKN